ncbi:MAG: DLW-39 family protein [Mycobacteriales bacterium]
MPKTLLLMMAAIAGGLLALRRTRARRAEQDLWAEAIKPVDLR